MRTTTITETGALPASLLAPGHVTVEGVVEGIYPFTADEGAMVRVEYVGGNATEHAEDDDVTVLATVNLIVLHALQDADR